MHYLCVFRPPESAVNRSERVQQSMVPGMTRVEADVVQHERRARFWKKYGAKRKKDRGK